MGTIVDAYFRGYDVVLVKDCVATTSPFGGLENVVYNIGNVGICSYRNGCMSH
jgi:nicotinamidase-related amidase